MDGVIAAAVLGGAMALAGLGFARRVQRESHMLPLAATSILATFVILVGDGAAWRGYSWPLALIVSLALVVVAWLPLFGTPQPQRMILGGRWPREAWGLGFVALALAIPLWILPVPLDTDAQGFGYLALTIRDGRTVTTLAPWHPEISYLYAPGGLLVFASLSQLLPSASMTSIMMGATHAAAFFFVWLAAEFGRELGLSLATTTAASRSVRTHCSDPASWMWASGLLAAISGGLWTALLDSHYTAIFGLLFSLAFLMCLFRYLRTGRSLFAGLAALNLAAVIITQADTALGLVLAYAALVLLGWLATDRPALRQWIAVVVLIPTAACAILLPWLARIWPLVQAGIHSPFIGYKADARVWFVYSGLLVPALALVGAVTILRRRPLWAILMVGWLAAVAEVSSLGLLGRVVPGLEAWILRFAYPTGLAWHTPIIPFLTLGAAGLLWLVDRLRLASLGRWYGRLLAAACLILISLGVFNRQVLQATKGRLAFYGTFASANDVLAMRWLRDHATTDTRVLNYPGDYLAGRDWEAEWAPVITERDCVYFRRQPFFLSTSAELDPNEAYAEQLSLLSFWRNPADLTNATLLSRARIDYVLVPDSVGDPQSWASAWRWQPPALLSPVRSAPSDASYLRLVYAAGGAQVYELRAAGSGGA